MLPWLDVAKHFWSQHGNFKISQSCLFDLEHKRPHKARRPHSGIKQEPKTSQEPWGSICRSLGDPPSTWEGWGLPASAQIPGCSCSHYFSGRAGCWWLRATVSVPTAPLSGVNSWSKDLKLLIMLFIIKQTTHVASPPPPSDQMRGTNMQI